MIAICFGVDKIKMKSARYLQCFTKLLLSNFQWKVRPLLDNADTDQYRYVMTVITGSKSAAGTNSKISFIIVGADGDSDVRVLADGHRKEHTKGSIYHFLVTVPYELGDLRFVRIWHDGSGTGSKASWYLQEIILHDVEKKQRYKHYSLLIKTIFTRNQ